jgi:MFS family permease
VRSWFRDTTGGLPTTFWYLWAGSLVNRLGSFVLIFLAIYLTKARGFSDAGAGLVIGLGGAGGAIGTMTGGVLADRWGRRPTLLTAHLGAAAAMVSLGLARGLWLIAACAFVMGAFAEAVRPAFSAMMVDVVPDRDRLRAFSLNYWAINLGFAGAAILAGFAAQANYLLLFVVDAGTTLITAAIVFLRVRETRPAAVSSPATAGANVGMGVGAGRPGNGRGSPTGLGMVLRDRVFVGFVLVNLLTAMVFLQHISMLPIAMGDDGLPATTFGLVISLNGILIVLGQLFIPRLIDGRPRARVLALATVILGAGFGLTALAGSAWLYAVTVLVWTVGEMLNSPSTATTVAELSPPHARGRYQGVLSLSWSVAAFAAPVFGGLVREHLGNSALWLGVAGVAWLAALAHLVSGPARERRAAALDAAAGLVPSPHPAADDDLAPTAPAP